MPGFSWKQERSILLELKHFRYMNKLPTISAIIPTLNAAKVLELCLESIRKQEYPKDLVEIIIADGGSTDGTLKIAKKFHAKIYKNPLKTGEAGKAVALRFAKGELVALIDSDNILPEKDWFLKMVAPFNDKNIFGTEPIRYIWRRQDGFITRYCALIGINDPLCLFMGNYDRESLITGRWTGYSLSEKKDNGYLKIDLSSGKLPTIGANGTILRRSVFRGYEVGDYYIDIDVIYELVLRGYNTFAKVDTGIIHLYCGGSIKTFIRKQKRRVRDLFFLSDKGAKTYPWKKSGLVGIIKFIVCCLLILPLIHQTIKGYLKKPDIAWFFHPLACWITLIVYGLGTIRSLFTKEAQSREKWSQ